MQPETKKYLLSAAFMAALVFVAFFGAYAGFNSQPPSPDAWESVQPPQKQSKDQRRETHSGQKIADHGSLVVQAIAPSQGSQEPAEPTNKKDDQSPPDWWMVRLTGGLLFVGGLQAYVFWVQAGRLKETVAQMQLTERRQLRAYAGVDKITFEITSNRGNYSPVDLLKPGTIYPDFMCIHVKNFGQTPAYDVFLRGAIAQVGHLGKLPPDFNFDEYLVAPFPSGNILTHALLSRDQIDQIKVPIPDARLIWNAQRQLDGVIIFGRIYYMDAFKQRWSTKFCYAWEPWHPPGERFVPYENFNGEDQAEP